MSAVKPTAENGWKDAARIRKYALLEPIKTNPTQHLNVHITDLTNRPLCNMTLKHYELRTLEVLVRAPDSTAVILTGNVYSFCNTCRRAHKRAKECLTPELLFSR
jgi:hypothetical protein